MTGPIMNSVIHPSVREGIKVMLRDIAAQRAKYEAAEAERIREEHARRERDAAAMRQTIEAFRTP